MMAKLCVQNEPTLLADGLGKHSCLDQQALFSTLFTEDEAYIHFARHQGVVLPDTLSQARTKRRAEFLAGRFCAMRGLECLGAVSTEVGICEDRGPRWPSGFTGSITHSAGVTLAAVARQPDIRAVGIDVEQWVPETRAEKLSRAILMDQDKQLRDSHQLAAGWFFTLAFSAKESLYKLLRPEVGRFFGFDAAVMVSLDV